ANISNCKDEYINVKKYWENLVNRIQVKTPVESINILLNGWLMYQVIASRLYARTGFYQSGGAYGFRDQLQDTLGIKYVEPKIMRNQILLHANHQFEEGDVEHWWHEETNKGIRTRISDDLLWLAYVVCDYIEFTGDYSILEEQIKYKKGKVLAEDETKDTTYI
ncbi:NdvB, partial [human gut metagenome]